MNSIGHLSHLTPYLRTAALALLLSGCAGHTWAPGPGVSAGDFEPTKARCSLMARHGGSDFVAYGNANYVAGAALGHAIGESIRTQADFNDCMQASGWRIADQTPQTVAAQQATLGQLRSIKVERDACFLAVRQNPRYYSLVSHLADISTGRYGMTQLADDRMPTPPESISLAAFRDETAPCRDKSQAAISRVAPAVAAVLNEVICGGRSGNDLPNKKADNLGRVGDTVIKIPGGCDGEVADGSTLVVSGV